MAKQKTKDKLMRIVEGAMGAAERAIVRVDALEASAAADLKAVDEVAAASAQQTANLGAEIRKAVADAVGANDTWYEFHVKPLEKRLEEAKARQAAATDDVAEVHKAIRELSKHRQAAREAIEAAAVAATETLAGAADVVTEKIEAARTAERNLDQAAQDCRKASGSIKDALAKLLRTAAQGLGADPASVATVPATGQADRTPEVTP